MFLDQLTDQQLARIVRIHNIKRQYSKNKRYVAECMNDQLELYQLSHHMKIDENNIREFMILCFANKFQRDIERKLWYNKYNIGLKYKL
jgi:hypothetical protein